MKKTILVVLMVATPCLAELEPASKSSIEGTLWRATYVGLYVNLGPTYEVGCIYQKLLFGFHNETVYGCYLEDDEMCTPIETPGMYYFDSPVLSIVYGVGEHNPKVRQGGWFVCFLSPLGIGFGTFVWCIISSPYEDNQITDYDPHGLGCRFGIIIWSKISEDFLPE